MDDFLIVNYDLAQRREIAVIAAMMRRSRFEVMGMVVTLWTWFSREAPDGHVAIDVATLADLLGLPERFLDCLLHVAWLHAENGVLSIPNWDKYLSPDAKARRAAAYYQRHRRRTAATPAPPKERRTNVKHLYNDDDDVKTLKGGVGENVQRTSNTCQTPVQHTSHGLPPDSAAMFGRLSALWGTRGPVAKRDRDLLWKTCTLAAEGHAWALAALDALATGKPTRPGAYLQKLVLDLGPRDPHVSLLMASVTTAPPEPPKPSPRPNPPKPQVEETPLTPEQGRDLIQELYAIVRR